MIQHTQLDHTQLSQLLKQIYWHSVCLRTSRHIRTQITVDTLSIFVYEHIDLLWLCTVRVLALQLYPSRTFNCKPGAQDCVSLPSLPTFPGKLGDLGKPCKHHPIIHQLQLVKLEDPSWYIMIFHDPSNSRVSKIWSELIRHGFFTGNPCLFRPPRSARRQSQFVWFTFCARIAVIGCRFFSQPHGVRNVDILDVR